MGACLHESQLCGSPKRSCCQRKFCSAMRRKQTATMLTNDASLFAPKRCSLITHRPSPPLLSRDCDCHFRQQILCHSTSHRNTSASLLVSMPSAIPSQITDATPMHVSFNKHCVFVGPSKGSRDLTIKFVRTNRVAEDIHVHEAPFPQHWKRDTPPLYNGRFPLYNVADFRKTIPPDASTQRGFFFPMYQHDAMWIQFESSSPFIVKVFAGGTNVLSGEPMEEDTATMTGRSELFRAQQNIQDYIVLPKQLWIDRIAERESIAKQFTATLPSSGPSVAAQILGEDKMKVLHFQITPAKHLNTAIHEIACKKIVVGAGTIFYCPFAPAMTVEDLKYAIMKKEGIPVCQQALICRVRLYDDGTRQQILHPPG